MTNPQKLSGMPTDGAPGVPPFAPLPLTPPPAAAAAAAAAALAAAAAALSAATASPAALFAACRSKLACTAGVVE